LTVEVLKPTNGDSQTAVILAHGAGQGMNSPFMTYFHTQLANRGLLSITFNFDYMDARRRMPDPQPKLQARYRTVVAEILAKHHPKRLIIGGKSMGARVASYITGDTPHVSGLVFLGYPLHPPGKSDQLRDQHLYELNVPMLFVSGTKDTFAERTLLERVVQRLSVTATLVWIEGGDHSLQRKKNDRESLQIAADAVITWSSRL
jgi:predicted alpha/beta-hydrolase family hydrolase